MRTSPIGLAPAGPQLNCRVAADKIPQVNGWRQYAIWLNAAASGVLTF